MGNENCSQLWYIFPFLFSAIVAVCANLCFGVHSSLKLKIGNAEKTEQRTLAVNVCNQPFCNASREPFKTPENKKNMPAAKW